MGAKLNWVNIAGVALLLFCSVLLGVGIHHLIATGTCSSTGYSANYGPVPHCPSGTGWWFAFLFVGIIGCLAGAMMAGNGGLIFAGIFGAIGFGALSLLLDSDAASSTQVFAAAFGGAFAIVGTIAAVIVVGGALRDAVQELRPQEVRIGKTKTSSRGAGTPSLTPATSMGVPTPAAARHATAATPALTPLNLLPGMQAARTTAAGNAVDELSKLAELHSQGGLTDQEFAAAKAKLLNEM